MRPDSEYQQWWQATWHEREDLLKENFGETSPPGVVTAFKWDDIELRVPGACALCYPPGEPSRKEWLTISHGLSQPLELTAPNPDVASGYGYEFGFLTANQEKWCSDALWLLLTYLRQSEVDIGRGHRVPFWYSKTSDGTLVPHLGKRANDDPRSAGEMRALLFWPYMRYPGGFSTSTGYFSILIGTSITQAEWEMAKATSSAHLLLLLFRAGIGQMSDLSRRSITDTNDSSLWPPIVSLSENEANALLLKHCNSLL